MKMNICVYSLYRMAYNNNIVSSFRDLCLETAVRFINHEDKCDFDLNTAGDILRDGWLLSYTCNIFNLLSLQVDNNYFRNRCVRSKY